MRVLAIDPVPEFEGDFDGLLNYLRDETAPTEISLKRYGTVMRMNMQAIMAHAQAHRNLARRAPHIDDVQRYLRETMQILRFATEYAGTVEKAIFWYKNSPLPLMEYKTPQTLVTEGRTEALIRYFQTIRAGMAERAPLEKGAFGTSSSSRSVPT